MALQNLNILNTIYIIIFRSKIAFPELVSKEIICYISLVGVKYSRVHVYILGLSLLIFKKILFTMSITRNTSLGLECKYKKIIDTITVPVINTVLSYPDACTSNGFC